MTDTGTDSPTTPAPAAAAPPAERASPPPHPGRTLALTSAATAVALMAFAAPSVTLPETAAAPAHPASAQACWLDGTPGGGSLADACARCRSRLDADDPKRVWSLGSDDPADLEAEISRLRAELGAYREALSRPFPVAMLHWPAGELGELVEAYPPLAAEYPSYEEHLASIEAALRELASSGTANLGVVPGTVPSYEAFAASEGASPADPTLLPQYATTLAARGLAVAWPPQRGAACWCGSGRTYGECHGQDVAGNR
ncbi:hypothetical protein STENM36S_01445 [Streptomyces tendae]